MSAPPSDLPSTPARVGPEVDANSEEKIEKSAEETPSTSSDLPSTPARVGPEVDANSEEKIEKSAEETPSTSSEDDTTSDDEEEVEPVERLDNFFSNFFRDIEYGPASKKFKVQFDWAKERAPWEQPPTIAGGDDPSSVLGDLISDLDPTTDAKRGRGDAKRGRGDGKI